MSIDFNHFKSCHTFEAIVDVDFTLLSHGTLGTSALKVIDQVVTGSTVEAGAVSAVVNVVLTLLALEPVRAVAPVGTLAPQVGALAAIEAGIHVTVIDTFLAVRTLESFGASTLMSTAHFTAGSSILAEVAQRDPSSNCSLK